MKSKVLIGLVLGAMISPCLLSADYVSWMDKKSVNHENIIVSVSTAYSMMVSKTKEVGQVKPVNTRVRIKQDSPCLCFEDVWHPEDYKVVNDNTIILNAGNTAFMGAGMGFSGDYTKCIGYKLGKKGCSLVGSKEYWDVEQKIDGEWRSVAKGHFVFVK